MSQPSKAIQLTTKNKAAYATQTVSFKATLEKESSTKAKDLEWTVSELSDNNKNLWYLYPCELHAIQSPVSHVTIRG